MLPVEDDEELPEPPPSNPPNTPAIVEPVEDGELLAAADVVVAAVDVAVAEEAAVAGDTENIEDETEIVYGFTGHEINLGPAIWEEIVLNAPTKFVCRENCAGLCPACGVNLNRETCGCGISHDAASGNEPVAGGTPGTGRKPMETKGLAGLADLFPDLKPTNSEE